jgi:hypothetical protein
MRVLLLSIALTAALPAAADAAGLGAVLTTKDGGQIYGFAINQHGDDGVLASAQPSGGDGDFLVSMETFDQNTGKIAKTFARDQGSRNSYQVDGIFAGDTALVTHFVVPNGTIYAKRLYDTMNPVTTNAFTGAWAPPVKDIDVRQASTDQESSTAVLFAIELKKQDKPLLLVSDVASGTFTKVIHLDPGLFGLDDGPQLGQFTAANEAIIALSPDAGTVGGDPPLNVIVHLDSGKIEQFKGYNFGEFHAGSVDGMAVDPNTGIAATTTALNSEVEFYDMVKKKGITAVQLPCTSNTDETSSGSGVAVDPVNKLFLVAEASYCGGGGAIVIYDEAGNLVNTITGFNFVGAEPAPVLNPSKRMGWAFSGTNGFNQLQQFFY